MADFEAVGSFVSRHANFALFDNMALQVVRSATQLDTRQAVLALMGRGMGVELLLGRLLRRFMAAGNCGGKTALPPASPPATPLSRLQQRRALRVPAAAAADVNRFAEFARPQQRKGGSNTKNKKMVMKGQDEEEERERRAPAGRVEEGSGSRVESVEGAQRGRAEAMDRLCLVVVPDGAPAAAVALLAEDAALAAGRAVAVAAHLPRPQDRAMLYARGGAVVVTAKQLVADLLHRRVAVALVAASFVVLRADLLAPGAVSDLTLLFATELLRGGRCAASSSPAAVAAGATLFVLSDAPTELLAGSAGARRGPAVAPPILAALHIAEVQLFPRNSLAVVRHMEQLGPDAHAASLIDVPPDAPARRIKKLLLSILRETVREVRAAAAGLAAAEEEAAAAADLATAAADATPCPPSQRRADRDRDSRWRAETLTLMAALTVEQVLVAEVRGVQQRLLTFARQEAAAAARLRQLAATPPKSGRGRLRRLVLSAFALRALLRGLADLSPGRFLLHLEAALQPPPAPTLPQSHFVEGAAAADRAERPPWALSPHVAPLLAAAQERVLHVDAATGTVQPSLGTGAVNAKLLATRDIVLARVRAAAALRCVAAEGEEERARKRAREGRQCGDADDTPCPPDGGREPSTILIGVDDTCTLRDLTHALLARSHAEIARVQFNDFLALYQLTHGSAAARALLAPPQAARSDRAEEAGVESCSSDAGDDAGAVDDKIELVDWDAASGATGAGATAAAAAPCGGSQDRHWDALLRDVDEEVRALCTLHDPLAEPQQAAAVPSTDEPRTSPALKRAGASSSRRPGDASGGDWTQRARAIFTDTASSLTAERSAFHEAIMSSQLVPAKGAVPVEQRGDAGRCSVIDVDGEGSEEEGGLAAAEAVTGTEAKDTHALFSTDALTIVIDCVVARRAVRLIAVCRTSTQEVRCVPIIVVLQRFLTAKQLLTTLAPHHPSPVGHYIIHSAGLSAMRALDVLAALRGASSAALPALPPLRPEIVRLEGEDLAWNMIKLEVDAENKAFFETWVEAKTTLSSELLVDRATRIRAASELGAFASRGGSGSKREGGARGGEVAAPTTTDAQGAAAPLIVFDERELRSALPFHLYTAGVDVVPMVLLRGDFVLGPDLVVERKSVHDLVGSTIGRHARLPKQLENMAVRFKHVVILVEFERHQAFDLLSHCSSATAHQALLQRLYKLLTSFPRTRVVWARTPRHACRVLCGLKRTIAVENPDVDECAMTNSPAALAAASGGGGPAGGSGGGGDAPQSDATRAAQRMLMRMPGVTVRNVQGVMDVCGSLFGLATIPLSDLERGMGDAAAAQTLYTFLHRPFAETVL